MPKNGRFVEFKRLIDQPQHEDDHQAYIFEMMLALDEMDERITALEKSVQQR